MGSPGAGLAAAMAVLAIPFLLPRPGVNSMVGLTVATGLLFGVVRTFRAAPEPETMGNLDGIWWVLPIYGFLRALQLVRTR